MDFNEYYDKFRANLKQHGGIEYPTDGSTFYGVLKTHYDYVNEHGLVHDSVYKFQRTLCSKSNRYENFRVKKDGSLYMKPNSYGWAYFATRTEAEEFVKSSKTLAQTCLKLKIKTIEEQIEALN